MCLTFLLPAGKTTLTHRTDMHKDMIALLCKKREVSSIRQIVALSCLAKRSLSDIVISLSALPFLDQFCTRLGIVDEPIIFQTAEDFKNSKTSILGKGVDHEEIALWWILGEMKISFLSTSFQSNDFIVTVLVLQKIFLTWAASSI